MGMDFQRQIDRVFDSADQLVAGLRRQNACHIFDTDRICAEVCHFVGKVNEVIHGMDLASSIRDRRLTVSTRCFCGTDGSFQIADII